MSEDRQTYQRAVNASLAGLAVQGLMALGLIILALWSSSAVVYAAAWHALGGLGIWASLWVVFQQHRLERIEALEAEQLAAQHGADSSIFEATADDLSVARRRLAGLYRWFVPIVSIVTSLFLMGMGGWLVRYHARNFDEAALIADRVSPLALAFIFFGITFFGFLVSRYVAGMARQPHWQLLRGGAAYMMGSTVIALALTLTFFIITGFEAHAALSFLAVIVPAFMALIGAEMAVNFILDLYRPRRAGEAPRPAFDSRLLSLLTTPESIAKTVSDAINYQFGFEITRSWFWQLLSRVFVWLVLFAAGVLITISSIVIVEPHQRAMVTRLGALIERPLEPGIHFKLPWPASKVEFYDVERVRVLGLGSEREQVEGMPMLWTTPHATTHEGEIWPMIVAPPSIMRDEDVRRAAGQDEEAVEGEAPEEQGPSPERAERAPSISLVDAEVELHYRIDPERLVRYIRANADADNDDPGRPARRLRAIAQQEVSRYLLRHDVDEWIGSGRVRAGARLQAAVQRAVERADLGVEVLHVLIPGIHPPQEVADAFHSVVQAQQRREAAIENAERDAIESLATVAGSLPRARQILQEIEALEEMKGAGAAEEQIAEREQVVERLLLDTGGEAAVAIAEARGYRWTVENVERGKAERTPMQSLAYRKAPELYQARALLDVLREGLIDGRKYILATDYGNLTIWGDMKDVESGFEGALPSLRER